MNHLIKIILLSSLCLLLVGCEKENPQWNPIIENTSFDYINLEIEQSLTQIDTAIQQAEQNRQSTIQKELQQARARLLRIKDYYVPLTTVRQKIYDAERYFKMNKKDEATRLLEGAKSIVTSLDTATKNQQFDKVRLKIVSMLDEAIATLNGNSKADTYKKLKAAGEHVNMILLKGELVLSEIAFDK
jgi:uncharacterized protein YdcH (DUF465 family)